MPTGKCLWGIYLEVTKHLEGGKCEGGTTVFSNDAVMIRWHIRSWLELFHQEKHRSQAPYEDSATTTVTRWAKYTHQFGSTMEIWWLHRYKVGNRSNPSSPSLLASAADGLHLKITEETKFKKGQEHMTVFTVDDVMLHFPTRLCIVN